MQILETLPVSPLALAGILFTCYVISTAVYRLFFSPVAHIPGPRLAALTGWYEFYYDCVLRGQYMFKIKELHEQYGPIIRINPSEIHVSTPDFYNTIYTQTGKRDTWWFKKAGFGIDVAAFTTLDHDLHRKRRSALNPLFSKQRIIKLQPVIQTAIDDLMNRIEAFGKDGKVFNIKLGYAALTADVAMDYFFGNSQKKLQAADFDGKFHDAIENGFNQLILMNQLSWVMKTITTIASQTPTWIMKMYFSGNRMTSFIAAQRDIANQVREVLARPAPAKEEAANHTIFDQILSSKLPEEEKSFKRLVQEGGVMVSAATVSTAWSLTVITYMLITHPYYLKKVKDEIKEKFPGGPDTINDLPTLEHMPWLSAVIQESLRFGIGVTHRSARINREGGIEYENPANGKKTYIPAGTPMSMSAYLMFRDESIFPNAETFRPERWLENPGLDRYAVAFSKGTRGCIGINLAMAEMNLMTAHLFSRYGSKEYSEESDVGYLELFETDDSDIKCVADGTVALQKEDTKGVRFTVHLKENEKA